MSGAEKGRTTSRLPFDGQASCDCKAVPVPHRVHDACMALLDAQEGRGTTAPASNSAANSGRVSSEPIVGPHTCSCDDCQRIYREHLARKAGRVSS